MSEKAVIEEASRLSGGQAVAPRFCDDCGYAVAEARFRLYPAPRSGRWYDERYYCGSCLQWRARNNLLCEWGLAVITPVREKAG